MCNIKISIIIPIHNVADYVDECIGSVIKQTLKEIEIICIDDASTDASLSVIKKYEKEDDRVKVIEYSENKSASQARKDGVLLAQGEYILFLDGDDTLKENACEELYTIAQKKKVDILHFGTEVINHGCADKKRIQNLYRLLKPYNKLLKGKDVFNACFVEKKYRFTLWNKMYTSTLCKRAFEKVQDGNFPKAQDLYAFFVLCYCADSYYGVNQQFYNYRFGAGITGKKEITLDQFERFCTSEWTAGAVQEFAENVENHALQKLALQIRYDLLNDCINNWYNFLPQDKQSEGFDLMTQYWNKAELAGKLCEKFFGKHYQLADIILNSTTMKLERKRNIKTIGIFYYRYTMGGVQRVISLLIPMLIELGYKVVFFTEEVSEEEYLLPENVLRVNLPPSVNIKKVDYLQRAIALENALIENEIDIMIYHAASSTKLLFEMIILKLLKIPTILAVHEVAFQCMIDVSKEFVNRPSVFRLADEVVVLSTMEAEYWRLLGVNAYYVPNPITNTIVKREPQMIDKDTIVWVGRLDARTKRYNDVVDAMKIVVSEIPNAKLYLVGNEVTPGAVKHLEKKIQKADLEQNVILCGATNDVDQYYQKASIHLLTSVSETFPMTIIESKSYGIPLVMYELPYLEIIKSGKGLISVPQENKEKLAQAMVRLLKDDNYREQLGIEAQESLNTFLEYDLKKAWDSLIQFDMTKESNVCADDDYRIMLETLIYHYGEGCKKFLKLDNDYKKIKNSKNYRLGQIILKFPKKIYYAIIKK